MITSQSDPAASCHQSIPLSWLRYPITPCPEPSGRRGRWGVLPACTAAHSCSGEAEAPDSLGRCRRRPGRLRSPPSSSTQHSLCPVAGSDHSSHGEAESSASCLLSGRLKWCYDEKNLPVATATSQLILTKHPTISLNWKGFQGEQSRQSHRQHIPGSRTHRLS